MSNKEYDALYDELVALEQETGVVLSGSPTVKVGYEVLSELLVIAFFRKLAKVKDDEAVDKTFQRADVMAGENDGLARLSVLYDFLFDLVESEGIDAVEGLVQQVIINVDRKG